jgi:hypothetical protein
MDASAFIRTIDVYKRTPHISAFRTANKSHCRLVFSTRWSSNTCLSLRSMAKSWRGRSIQKK